MRGVAFRAIGQEPGWLLEITDGVEILLVTDYGANRMSYPWIEPEVDPEVRLTRYSPEAGDVVIEIRCQDCTDVMSGEAFAVTVIVTLKARTLRGCGRALY